MLKYLHSLLVVLFISIIILSHVSGFWDCTVITDVGFLPPGVGSSMYFHLLSFVFHSLDEFWGSAMFCSIVHGFLTWVAGTSIFHVVFWLCYYMGVVSLLIHLSALFCIAGSLSLFFFIVFKGTGEYSRWGATRALYRCNLDFGDNF